MEKIELFRVTKWVWKAVMLVCVLTMLECVLIYKMRHGYLSTFNSPFMRRLLSAFVPPPLLASEW